jgi:hypothetical protein
MSYCESKGGGIGRSHVHKKKELRKGETTHH